MENEMLKVKFIETSGAKDLGGRDHLKASGGREKKTEKLQEHSVRSAIHKATGITNIEIGEKKLSQELKSSRNEQKVLLGGKKIRKGEKIAELQGTKGDIIESGSRAKRTPIQPLPLKYKGQE